MSMSKALADARHNVEIAQSHLALARKIVHKVMNSASVPSLPYASYTAELELAAVQLYQAEVVLRVFQDVEATPWGHA